MVFTDIWSKLFKKNLFTYSRFSRGERMIDSSCGISFQGRFCLLWLLFPFLEFSVNGKSSSKNKAQKKPLSNWNCQSNPLRELGIIITCNRYGSKNKCSSRNFFGSIIIKMLLQLWRHCRKWLLFTTTKISISWSLVVLYQTWLRFAYTNLLMTNSILSLREMKTYWIEAEKTSLVVHLSFSHAKIFLMKLSSESLQT